MTRKTRKLKESNLAVLRFFKNEKGEVDYNIWAENPFELVDLMMGFTEHFNPEKPLEASLWLTGMVRASEYLKLKNREIFDLLVDDEFGK